MQSPAKVVNTKPFKLRKSLETRKSEVIRIKAKFPTKIPVIVERYTKEKYLPRLDKTKFLVPQDISMSQFINIIRNRMDLSATQAFYILVNNKSLASMSLTISELYRDNKDEDGFLYMTYASQEMFGRACTGSFYFLPVKNM
ncbi:microtubule-associated proteins 1A/1B light chain 3C [Pseudophryne corroboree]|uniref:microtubule-associated proteins 1A/1B light chain 3C n=1 Tax=Pseudophryne corroboree TaxID=495146 RepID=UPI003081DB3C